MVNQITQNPALQNQDMGNARIVNMADAVDPTDAAAFDQVDARTSGNSPVRQTVQNGHVDSQGLPNLLIAGENQKNVKTQFDGNDLLKNIRLFYPFDSISSGDFTDKVNGQQATGGGTVSLNNGGIRGNCADFSGLGQLDIPNQLSWIGDNDFFLSLWVKSSGSTSLEVILNESAAFNSNSFFVYIDASDNFGVDFKDGSDATTSVISSGSYDVTEWHHLIINRTGTTGTLYIDGSLDNTATVFGGNISANGDSVIGGGSNFAGLVDELGGWARSTNSNDISLLYKDPLNVGLRAFYSLDGDATDELGNFDGTNNGATFSSGLIGQAATFSDTYITLGRAFNFGTGNFTIQAWFKPTTTSQNQTIFTTDTTRSGDRISVTFMNDGTFRLLIRAGGTDNFFSGSTTYSIDNYYHVFLTRSGDNFKVSINDSVEIDINQSGYSDNASAVSAISRSGATERIVNDGQVDLVGSWGRVLSDNERSLLYQNGKGRSYDNFRDLNPLSFSEFAHAVPVHLTFGDGFSQGGQRNFGVKLDTVKTWDNLSTSFLNYLYLDYDANTGTITPGSTTVPPLYDNIKPATAQIGQYWYPVDHRSRGEYLDNTGTWQPVLRLFVGEASVGSNGVVNLIRTYAYLGRALVTIDQVPDTSFVKLNHNMGTNKFIRSMYAQLNQTLENWNAGSTFDISGSTPGGWAVSSRRSIQELFATHGSTFPNFTNGNGGPAGTDPAWSNFSLIAEYVRSF